jgi:hypothetical protein
MIQSEQRRLISGTWVELLVGGGRSHFLLGGQGWLICEDLGLELQVTILPPQGKNFSKNRTTQSSGIKGD